MQETQTCKPELLNPHGHWNGIILVLVAVCHSTLLRTQELHIEELTHVSQSPSSLLYLKVYMAN